MRKKVSVTLDENYIEEVKALGRGNLSKGLNSIIQRWWIELDPKDKKKINKMVDLMEESDE